MNANDYNLAKANSGFFAIDFVIEGRSFISVAYLAEKFLLVHEP